MSIPKSEKNQTNLEKMYLVEWLEVSKHSRTTVLKMRQEDVAIYDIRPHDKIRVQLQILKKMPRDDEDLKEVSAL